MANTVFDGTERPISASEILSVLEGKDVAGRLMTTRPSYPKQFVSVSALNFNARELSQQALALNSRCLSTAEQRTALVRRLASYLVAIGRPSSPLPPEILDAIARSIAQDPKWYAASGIAGIVRRATAKRAPVFEVIELYPEAMIYADGALVLWELTHPNHLQAETSRTGNCVGSVYDEAERRRAGADPCDARFLTYWRRIAKGRSRLFSLRTKLDRPVATIEYDVKSSTVTSIQHFSSHHRAVLSFLARATYRRGIRLRGLPTTSLDDKFSGVLLCDGKWNAYDQHLAEHIVGGSIQIAPDTEAETFLRLMIHPGLHIDMDERTDHLIPLIKHIRCASLYSFGSLWPVQVSRIDCPVYFENLRTASFRSLRSVAGLLSLSSLVEGDFPSLTSITGDLEAGELMQYTFPVLKKVSGGLHLPEYIPAQIPCMDVVDLRLAMKLRDFRAACDH